jgi:hypothetical protein
MTRKKCKLTVKLPEGYGQHFYNWQMGGEVYLLAGVESASIE